MKSYVPRLATLMLTLACAPAGAAAPEPIAIRSAPTQAPRAIIPAPPLPTEATPVLAGKATPIAAVTSVGNGQAGYVHYFLITHPDGDLEYQVGIELEDQRIAWSFPDAGVMVSEFVKKGTINSNDKVYKIEHLHGIRPFLHDADMGALQKELARRVAQWIDAETPYCLFRRAGEAFCLSCGDFVVRVLYPGPHPLFPALPRDFVRMTGAAYTTDDLLLYFVGLHGLPDKRAMLAKLATLEMPALMREDIIAMIDDTESTPPPATAAAAAKTVPASTSKNTAAVQQPTVKPAPPGRIATRRMLGKKI